MNAEVIGTWAGQVWNALNESGKLTVKGLKKATKLKEKELYAALGWLAREGKVSMYEVDADIEVVLLNTVIRRFIDRGVEIIFYASIV